MRRRFAWASAVAALSVAAPAAANPADQFGFGARAPGQGNASVASRDALESPIYNAAAGAATEHVVVGAGYSAAHLSLDLDGSDANLLDPRGVWGGFAVPMTLGAFDLAFAVALYIPDQFLLRLYSRPATERRFVLWDAQPHRMVSNGALSLRWKKLVSLGLGASTLGDATGTTDFNLGARPGRPVASSRIDTSLPMRTALLAGVLVTPSDEWSFGARFSDELALRVDLAIQANVTVEGTPLTGTTTVPTHGIDYFTPRELAVGAAWQPKDWRIEGDLVWQQWSAISAVSYDVSVKVHLGVDTPVTEFHAPPPGWRDVWSPHLGVERRLAIGADRAFTARAGWWYAPSPVPVATGVTNFADSNRHVLTLGTSFTFPDLGVPLGIDLAGQLHLLERRDNHKRNLVQPGGDFSNGGHVIAGMVGLHVEL